MAVTIDGTSGINTPGVVNTAAETIATTLAVTGVTTFAAGTAALPAITTTGDTNTGIFFPAADTIGFAEGGAEAMRIDSSGNVGIGTSSPTEKLTVSGAVIATSIATSTARDGTIVDYQSGVASRFIAGRAGGNYATWQALVAGASGITKRYELEYDGSARWYADNGSTERARIDSSGRLLVGKTSTTGSANVQVAATPGGNPGINIAATTTGTTYAMLFYTSDSVDHGYISYTTSGTSYNTTSDYRLKEAILPMTGALAKVAQLKPVTYKWKADGADGQGFIAHELQAVVPECVTREKDAVDADGKPQYQGIDTSFLVATLTAAIQELHALVKTQDSTITALTTRITALEAA